MNCQEIAFKDLTIQKMKKLRSSLVEHSINLEKHALLETLIDSMSTISIRKDLNGMKYAVNKLKITIL